MLILLMRLDGLATICAMLALTCAGGISDSCRFCVVDGTAIPVGSGDVVASLSGGNIVVVVIVLLSSGATGVSIWFCNAESNSDTKFMVATIGECSTDVLGCDTVPLFDGGGAGGAVSG